MLKTEEEKPTSLLNSQARDIVLTRSKFCSLYKKRKIAGFGNYLQHIYMDESTETSTKKRKCIEEPADKDNEISPQKTCRTT